MYIHIIEIQIKRMGNPMLASGEPNFTAVGVSRFRLGEDSAAYPDLSQDKGPTVAGRDSYPCDRTVLHTTYYGRDDLLGV